MTTAENDPRWDSPQECRPCSPDDALRFIRDMNADSPAVRLMLQWEHMLLDGTEYAGFLDGEGTDEQSRLRIIGFTQMIDSGNTDDFASIDWILRGIAIVCHYMEGEFPRIIRESKRDMDHAVRILWDDYGDWSTIGSDDPIEKSTAFDNAFSQPPAMMAGYAMGNEWWAQGMADVLRQLRSWSDGLVSSGNLNAYEAKTSMVVVISRALTEAFGHRTAGDMVSPAAMIMSMASHWHMDDDHLTSMRRHWPDDLPRPGFGLLQSALRMMMKVIQALIGPASTDATAIMGNHNSMFAAITSPVFASDPDRAVTEAWKTIDAVEDTKPAEWSAAQSWNRVGTLPFMPLRIVEELHERVPLTALSTISLVCAIPGKEDAGIVDDMLNVDWHDVTVRETMIQARRMFPGVAAPTRPATEGSASVREPMAGDPSGEVFRQSIYNTVKSGDGRAAAAMVLLEQIISGVCVREDGIRQALDDCRACDELLIINGVDLAEAVKGIIEGMLPPDFIIQTLAAESMTFTARMNIGRWDRMGRMERMSMHTRMFSFNPEDELSDSGVARCHVGVYWSHD